MNGFSVTLVAGWGLVSKGYMSWYTQRFEEAGPVIICLLLE